MIRIENIDMKFKGERTKSIQHVLKNVSFDVKKGDCLGILGESGSGKSTLGRIITGLLEPSAGKYFFEEHDVYLSKENRKFLSQSISIVFQDYNTSVNPRFTAFDIIKESLAVLARRTNTKIDYQSEIKRLLKVVGLDDSYLERYPHQLSGGQLQRVCIARALAVQPKVILFDEAVSSLDAHTQVQIMDLLKEIQQKFNLTYLFITHDLSSVTYLCNRVLFLLDGRVTEILAIEDLKHTKDEYAQKLLSALIEI